MEIEHASLQECVHNMKEEELVKNQPSTCKAEPAEENLTTEANSDGMDKKSHEHMIEEGGAVKTEEELTSINSMMSTVMNVGQINGVDTDSTKASPKIASKSLTVSRTGRRNQEVKEERSSFICPLCNKNCLSQHQLTMHIRQHNTDSGGTDHSCSICGKALSSASSLDRHMLVHSGERPYTCVVCHQTFTTNGNMHRHMKIHEKDASSIPTPSSSPLNKPRRLSAKKRIRLEEDGEQADERSNKKMMLMQKAENLGSVKSEEELFHCPICFKTFICKYGLESHMETHPETTLRCNICCITFRTHRGLLRHNSSIHKQLPTDPAGRPFIQSNPSIPLGFGDLAFIDFSCSKFPQIAQVWCETNLRRCASKFHKFVCDVCNKAFPLQQSLDLHRSSHKNIANTNTEPQESNTDAVTNTPKEPIPQVDASSSDGKNGFMESLGLQNSYLAKPEKSGEQIQQEVLDSIRFIRIETPSTNLPQKTSSLGFSLLEPVSLQGMKKNAALSLLSLQPLHGVVSGGMLVPISSQTAVELTDIEQILKIAASPHMALSLLPTVQGSTLQLDPKQIASLKPKPLITPRSSMGTSTPPPPIMSAQKASSGNISPSLPPQTGQQQRGAGRSSASSSSSNSSSPTKWEASQTTSDIMLYDAATEKIKQEEFDSKELKNQTTKQKATKTEYPCRFCKEVFSFLGGLQAHMRHHLGASPYQCNACSYAAPDKATLIRHMRTHSGERPYICRICHYPFTVKANCERHLRKKHMKNTRKEIEKNIEYVANSSSASSAFGGATLDLLDTSGVAPTSCRYCGEDLKNYRALQIHLRTHNGCQRKPFECRQCGAAFLAKRNCILHLLKQHPDVPEREIEERIKCLLPVGDATLYANQSALTPNGPVKSLIPPVNQDQPLDFSSRSQKVNVSDDKTEGMTYTLADECSMEPIDLSLPKGPAKKRIKTEVVPVLNHQEVKKEQTSPKTENNSGILALSISNLPSALSSDLTKPITRLKPLLPKPSITVEMAPLASIAKIISSVSGPPMLMEADANGVSSMEFNTFIDKRGLLGTMQNGSPPDNLKRKCKKRQFQEEICDLKIASGGGGGIDLESSGEFPSVEKMLATTDSNTFSTYLQPQQMVPVKEEKEMLPISEEMMEGKEEKPKKSLQNKGKKNAYSNSVQKMTCPFCPRLFPWASSLQRHMLTHTGQKPYPCPHCESFFSTKSNCERHLLRKHGVSNRTLQNNASRAKTKTDEGSQGSTGTSESISDTEPGVAGDTTDASSDILKQEENSSPPEQETEQTRQSAIEQIDSNKDPNTTQAAEDTPEKIEKGEDDFEIDKNLDVNSHSTLEAELSLDEQYQPKLPETLAEPAGQQDEFPHTCATCKMTFRNTATYSVHQKTHVQEVQLEDEEKEGQQQPTESVQTPQASPRKETEQEADIKASESEESNSCVESGAEEEKIERDEMSDDEEDDDASSELRGLEEGSEQTGGKPEKRKKVCIVCSKRFWSLQDLTRHMRSHTGERPYKCQTCCRTFTLKHSLVRHQRVHQKPTDERGNDEAEMNEETDDTGLLEEIEVSCPSEKEGDATSPVQAESEGERADLPEEDENDRQIVENDEEKQNPADTDVKDSSPRDPQPEAEQEIRVDEPLIHVASDLESAKTSIQCTTAQETAEKENH